MASEDEFDVADLCFASNVETDIFNKFLFNETEEKANDLTKNESETKEFTDLEKGLYPLTKGQIFINWKDVESYLDKHGHERGFAFLLAKSELDKNNGIPRHHVYYCSKGHCYEIRKKAYTLEERNKAHESNGYEFHINFHRWKSNNQIHLSEGLAPKVIYTDANPALISAIESVLAFTHRFFNCGIQSTQRVEVYNAILKKSLNGTTTLMEVGMFSEDLYDEILVELTELVSDISPDDIKELRVFHIGILAKRWFSDWAIQKNEDLNSKRAISIRKGQDFGTFEHKIQHDFSLIDSIHSKYVFMPKIQNHVKSHSLYGKSFGLMKKALNLAIETGCTGELYKLHQQFIANMKRQLAEQEGNILELDEKNYYGRKHQKRIAAFNDSPRKKVLKESTSMQHSENLVETRTGLDTVTSHEDMLESITQGKKKHAYICGNCGKDGHCRSCCPNMK
ncbi:3883_t:CDS:2 [Cetraspora pellucida]|uniref:3883_t:CDS:1 n=1 Tax=Cetraspora pellucida TaxID=1433469 RepID=A0A9N9JGC2_9GLOM|nr:3883_t:CDS:2 [Cetraspora pellucida]